MFNQKNIITAIELGTTKISVAMAELTADDELQIIAVASCKSNGAILKGEVIEIKKTAELLRKALTAVENMTLEEIVPESTYVAITAADIQFTKGEGELFIDDSNGGTVSDDDIETVAERVHQGHIPNTHISINKFDSYYLLNDKHIISNPLGHSAFKIKAFTHIIHGDKDKIRNIENILQDVGFDDYIDFIFAPIASALATLSELEQDKGALLIDIGAGATEYAVMYKEGVLCSGVITVGMDHVINDLAVGLDIHRDVATQIVTDGKYQEKRNKHEAMLTVAQVPSKRNIPVVSIEQIIKLRLHELFEIIHKELMKYDINIENYSGVVITGGGALFQQVNESVKEVFEAPVRVGNPVNYMSDDCLFSSEQIEKIDLKSPRYSTLLGIFRYATRSELMKRENEGGSVGKTVSSLMDKTVDSVMGGLKNLKEAIKL